MSFRRVRPGAIAVLAGAVFGLGLTACSDDSDGDGIPTGDAALRGDCETVQKVLNDVAEAFPYGPHLVPGERITQQDVQALIKLREGFQRNRFHSKTIQDRLVESIAAISRLTTDPSKPLKQRWVDRFSEAGNELGKACAGEI
jgi:hypothetical protein